MEFGLDKIASLEEAISEAKRFIKRASEAKERLKAEPEAAWGGCKEVAAAKRASMDLSRSLVKVRQA
jgi:hypothetical protein